MNNYSAVTTCAAGVSAAMLASVITWACEWPLKPPPPDVAMGMAALAISGLHGARNWINRRWPAPIAAPAPVVTPPVAAVVAP